jgi:hypothetical protein
MSCFQTCRLRSSSEIHLSPKYISVMGTAINCTCHWNEPLSRMSYSVRSWGAHDVSWHYLLSTPEVSFVNVKQLQVKVFFLWYYIVGHGTPSFGRFHGNIIVITHNSVNIKKERNPKFLPYIFCLKWNSPLSLSLSTPCMFGWGRLKLFCYTSSLVNRES